MPGRETDLIYMIKGDTISKFHLKAFILLFGVVYWFHFYEREKV